MKKRFWSIVLAAILILSLIPTAAAANYTTNYNSYSTPSSSDYAYWSGSRVICNSGTTTSEVKWMQAALNYCIANKGLNASYLDVDGSFGPASEKACLAFQRQYGLSADGSFGPSTISKMKEVLSAPAPKPDPAPAPANYTSDYNSFSTPGDSDYAYWSGSEVVRGPGTSTSEIKWMQAALNYCIANKGLNASYLDVDGSFGPASEKACLAFQRQYGLSADGSFGPSTISKMKEVLNPPEPKPQPQPEPEPEPPTPTPVEDHTTDYGRFSAPDSSDYAYWDDNGDKVIRNSGTTTSEVKWMQAALNYCIANKGLSASYLDVDGSFGPASQTATKAFQRKYGLSADGSFGPDTINAMKAVLDGRNPITNDSSNADNTSNSGSNTSTYSGTADDVIALAKSKLGCRIGDFGWDQDWCGYFVCSMGRKAGANFPTPAQGGNVRELARWFVNNGAGTMYYFEDSTRNTLGKFGPVTNPGGCVKTSRSALTPRKGDLFVLYSYGEGWDHVGFVESYSGGTLQTVEGNTSGYGSATQYKYNSKVDTKARTYNSAIMAIVRPNYTNAAPTVITPEPAEEVQPASYDTDYSRYTAPDSSDYAYWNGNKSIRATKTTTSEVQWMQAALNYCIKNKELSASYLDTDGSFGPASKQTTEAFQRKYGLSADGSFGPATITKMKSVLGIAINDAPINTSTKGDSKITTQQIQNVLNKYGYTTGKYWTYPSGGSATKGYTASNRAGRQYSYSYEGVECYGFANFIMHEITGTTVNPNRGNTDGWTYLSASQVTDLRVGDIVRIGKNNSDGHTGVVLTVDNNGKCTFAECWGGVKNKLNIGSTLTSRVYGTHSSLSTMKSRGVLLYVYRYTG